MGDRNITKEERVFMEVSKQDDVKKSNKQWLRYGATSVLVALGMGAAAAPNVTANETTAGSQPGAFATSESDESVDTKDTDDRDKDGDGRDDETGEPVAEESSSEVTEEPNNESEEKPAETPQETPVATPETTKTAQEDSNASDEDANSLATEMPAETVVAEMPENVETSTNDVAVEPETSETDTESGAPSEVAEMPTSEESTTSESSEASSEVITENSEASDEPTNESEPGETDVESVSEASSDETEAETETPEEDTGTAGLGEGTDVTVMQEPVANPAAETATAEEVVTVSAPGTYAADEIIQVANAFDGNAPVEFKATDYGIDETVTVTYEDNRFLWINMSLNAKLNNVDMTALKAFAVRNRLNIAFTQEGERPKDATTGLTDTQQASLDLFNKEAFNLREETQVSNEAGTLLVYWPTRGDAYSDAFDTTDHSDVSHFADKIDMPWIVASASEMRTAVVGQNPSPGDSVADNPNLPAGIKGNTALLQAYMPIEAVIGTDNRTYMLMVARPGVTTDDTGQAVKPLQTMIAIQYSSTGTGNRTYITSTADGGNIATVAGMQITNNYSNGNWGFNITNAIAVGDGNGKTDGAPANTTTRTNWLRYSNANTTAQVRYYVKQADGSFKQIGPIEGATASTDAQNNALYGGASPYYSDQFTFTTDGLPGYKLISSMTQVSGSNVTVSAQNSAGQMTITGQFSGNDYGVINGINWYESAALYSVLLDPNSPFDLATVQALYPDLNLTKIPKGAMLYTISKGGSTATWINWPIIDANGNYVAGQRATFTRDGANANSSQVTDSSVLQLYKATTVTDAQAAASNAAGNPVWPTDTGAYFNSTARKDVSLSTAVLSYYLSSDGKTVKASATAISGYTKITGDLYRDASGKYTTSATDSLGNRNQLAFTTPDYLDADFNGSIDGNFAFRTGGTNAAAYASWGTGMSLPSGVSLYFEAIPQNATVDYQTATVDSSGKITLTTNKVPNKTQAKLTAVTGDQIGVPVQGDTTTNNSWSSKTNTTAPAGYIYAGFTYNGGELQSIKKADGSIAMPNEVNTVKYTSTALSGAAENDDKIVLYYIAVQQTANVTFSYQTGTTGPAISSASTTGNSSATINATNGSAAKGNTTIVLDANGINVAAAIPKGYHVVSSAMTSGTGLTYSDTTKTITGAFDATANGSSGTDSTQQTINLVLAADSQTANVVVSTTSASTPTYKAGASVDKATGGSTTKITFSTASDTTLKQAGYTYTVTGPDGVVYATLAAAMAATPNYDTTANGSSTTDATPQTFTVTYVADKQTANVVISSTSATTPKYAAGAKVDTVSGDSNTKITFATASDANFKQAGYSYTVTGPDGKTYATLALAQAAVPNFDATDNNGSATDGTQQNFTVNYTIDKQTANVTVSSTSDTTPKYAAGAKVDTATGGSSSKISFTTASDTNIKQAGYTYTVTGPDGVVYPTLAAAMAATPNYDTTSNGTSTTDATPQNFTVTYKADTQSIQINFKMADGSTPPASVTASGKTGTAIAQTVTAPAGYHFATTAEISANPSYAVATTGTKVLKFDGVSSVTGSYDDTNNNGATTDSSPQTMTLTLVPDKQEIQIKFVVDRGTATAPSNISVSGASNAALDSKSTMTVQSGVTLTDGGVTITAPKIPTGYSIDVAATNADAANTAGKLTFTSDGLTATVSGMYDTTANGAATTDGTPQVYVIHLVQDDAKLNVKYIDVNGSTKTTGFTPTDGAEVADLAQALKGGSGQSYTNDLADYASLGYVLVGQDAGATSGTYDMVPDDSSTSQTYYVYLKHDTTTVTPSTPGEPGQPINPDNPDSPLYPADNTAYKTTQEIKQITNYVVTDGGVANPPSYTQTTNWGREVTLDKVTGEVISATDWQVLSENDNGSDVTSADDDWHAVDSPVIDGYYADKAVIPAETITQDSFASTDYTQTNTVTYTKLGNYVPSFPDDTTVPSVPYGNDPDDPTSPSTPSIPYVPGYTPHDPDGNPLTPIDPEDPEKGYVPPTPKNPGQDTPINYTADEQVAEVIYIDDTTGQQLRKDALNGKTNQTSTYLTADQIAAYVAAGYTFVSDDTPNPLVFDDVADFDSEGYPIKTSQIYEVHLKQVVVTVDPSSPLNPGDNPFTPGDPVDPSDPSSPTYPSTPGEPGQPIDPSNPSGPTWPATPTAPEGLQEQDLNKTVTRTIHYWYTAVNGTPVADSTVTQTVQYAREGYLNAVTGEVTYGAWQVVPTDGTDDTLDAVNSPVITGWVADKPSIVAASYPAGTAAGDANDTKISALKDTEENVVYTKMGQYVPSIPANPGGSTPSTPEPITYPNDPDDPTDPREPDPSGEPGTPDNPTIPYVPGYTPNDPNEPHNPLVPLDPEDPSKGYWPPATPEDPTKDTVIVYTPDDQKAQVTYIDQDTGLSLAIDPLVGDTNTKSDYTTAERIKAFEQQGYVLVSDGFTAANPDGLTFDADKEAVQEYEVYLKHVVLTIDPDDPQNPSTPVFNPGDPVDPDDPSGPTYPATPGTPGEPIDPDNPSGPTWPATPTYPDGLKATDLNNTVDLTVHYVYEDGQMAHEDYTDNVKFTRTATLDTVTGKVTYSEWTPVNDDKLLDAHKSPVIEGYYASAENSTAVTAAALDNPYEQTITYKKLGAYVPSFPDTVTDVPSDPQQYPNDPDDPTTPLEPDGNPNTPGSPDNPTLPYVPGYTPEDPNGDPLKPVDPDNPSKGYWPPATPGSPVDPTDPNSPTVPGNPGDDTTIKYVADEQKVTIQYYDDDSKTMLVADDVFGDSDTTVSYTTAERIKAYEQAGYILVHDGFTTDNGQKYDHDTAADQVFEVHLKQSTVTVDPSTPGEPGDPVFTPGDPIDPANPSGPTYPAEPGNPGEPIDPANPSGPTWPETPTYPTGLSQSDLNKTVTRTIRYWITKVDGTKAAETVTQTVTYSRVAHYNPITQAITYDPWIASETDGTNTTLDEVVSPVVAGYVADKPSVGATTYATGSASGDANDQAISDAPVSTIVDVIYTPLGSYVPSFPAGEKTPSVPEVPYGNNPDDPTTPAEPGEPGSPTLPYVPGYTPSSPNGPVTPIYPGDPVDPSDPSSPTYPENPDKPDTPIGYTPPATPSDPATDTPIIYNADKQYATVTFIDDDTKQTLAVDKLSGGSNTRSTYLTDDKIKAYEAAGYTLVSDDYPDGGMVFDDDGKVNQSYTVHLKHTTVTVDPSSPQDPSTPISIIQVTQSHLIIQAIRRQVIQARQLIRTHQRIQIHRERQVIRLIQVIQVRQPTQEYRERRCSQMIHHRQRIQAHQ